MTDPVNLETAARYRRAGRFGDAEIIYRTMLQIQPDNPAALYELGTLLQQHGHHVQAIEVLRRASELRQNDPWSKAALAVSLKSLGRLPEAMDQYLQVIDIDPSLAGVHNNLGNIYMQLMRHEDAERCFRQAIQLAPDDPLALQNLAGVYTEQGKRDEALELYRRSIKIRPDYAKAHHYLSLTKKHENCDEEIAAMERLLENPNISARDTTHLCFGLGKAYEDLGEHTRAFDFWTQGNELKYKLDGYCLQNELNELGVIRNIFQKRKKENASDVTIDGPTPIFLIGMPRSGTSLTEQILANHSLVSGVGELSVVGDLIHEAIADYPDGLAMLADADWRALGMKYTNIVDQLSKGSAFIVDKMPSNFKFVGAIRRMLPNARIVHCLRDPLDTCVSCFKTYFVHPQLGFTGDLSELGTFYRHYRTLMDHWHHVHPGWIYDTHYERLVEEPESTIRDLLDALGLPFERACVEYRGSDRPVATASAMQVRDPIHRRSVGSWKRYERGLRPLISALESA